MVDESIRCRRRDKTAMRPFAKFVFFLDVGFKDFHRLWCV